MPSPSPATTGIARPLPDPPVRASGECSFLNPVVAGIVAAPASAFARLRGQAGRAALSAVESVENQAWSTGTPSAAEAQNVTIGTQTIRVVKPVEAATVGKNLPTIAQAAEALRAIPANQRLHTSNIVINPNPHPSSSPGRTTAAEAGSGKIDFYPMPTAQSQNDFDNRFMHEAAHNYQGHLWRSGEAVAQWGQAGTADDRSPSRYANRNTGEDFCEFLILFNAVRRTECESIARQMYPNRWRKMLEYESG